MRRFLQGLGLGLVIAAVVMGIGLRNNGSIADESIVDKARELGMVFPQGSEEPMDVDEIVATPSGDTEAASGSGARGAGVGGDEKMAPTQKPKATKKPKSTKEPTEEPDQSDGPRATTKTGGVVTEKPRITETPEDLKPEKGTTILFTVRPGYLSSSVARDMRYLGIIDDEVAFDHYLSDHGLGTKILDGDFKLKVGDSYANLARILTSQPNG